MRGVFSIRCEGSSWSSWSFSVFLSKWSWRRPRDAAGVLWFFLWFCVVVLEWLVQHTSTYFLLYVSFTIRQDNSVRRIFLTMFLFPISGDLTGDARLQALLRRWQADGLHPAALLCTLPIFGPQLQQGCKTIINESLLWLHNIINTEAFKDVFIPISLLKFPSLLSNPSWMMTSSTLNVCSTVRSVSFRAFFPRLTEKWRPLVWELKHKFTRGPINLLFLSCAVVTRSDLTSYPSGKQWAAVRTQQAEIRLPPQRKTFSLDLLRQNMAATHGWDSTVATVPPTIFICFLLVRWPHVSSAAGGLKTKLKTVMGKKHENSIRWVQ